MGCRWRLLGIRPRLGRWMPPVSVRRGSPPTSMLVFLMWRFRCWRVAAPCGWMLIVPSPVDVSGSASDDVGVTQVQVFVKDRSSGQYWNGSGWQPEFISLDADVDAPGSMATGWSFEFDLGGLPVAPAGYQATARSLDAAGKRSAWFSTYFDVGVPDVEVPLLACGGAVWLDADCAVAGGCVWGRRLMMLV